MAEEVIDQVEEQVESQEAPEEQVTEQPERIVVTIGEPNPEEAADNIEAESEEDTPVIKKIRKAFRDKDKEARDVRRELAELKAKINAQAPQVQEEQLPPEPKLEDDDIGYDTDKYKARVIDWLDKKRKYDEAAAEKEKESKTAEEKWKTKLASYQQARVNPRFEDFESAEVVTQTLLNQVQQGIIVHGAKDPALVVYALGKNEAEAKRIAAIKDPIEFAFEIARLEEKDIKVNKKPSVQPERRVSGNAGVAGVTDSTLSRLRAEAEKTGDMSKVIAYKNSLRKKA
jgi:hypothetical protein